MFFLLANKGGRNAPAAGAPVDGGTNCSQCHSGGQFQHDIEFTIMDEEGNVVEEYAPNTSYTVTMKGKSTGGVEPNSYGFQMVALNGQDSTGGTFSELSDDVRSRDFGDKGRLYLLQSRPRTDGTFSAKWTTPNVNTGDITFYISMLAINGNNGTSGDRNLSKSFVVNEAITSSNSFIEESINIYPNPAQDYIQLGTDVTADIININGAIMRSAVSGRVDVSTLTPGQYLLKTNRGVGRFIKL